MYRSIPQKSLACFIAFILTFCLAGISLLETRTAFAVTEETEAELTETQQKIEETAEAYDEAIAQLDDLEKQIEETEEKIKDLEDQLPLQQEKSNEATVALYKLNQEGFSLVNMILSAESLDEFITTFEYVNQIQQTNINEINRLSQLKEELEETKTSLDERKQEAEIEKTNAEDALGVAQSAREAIQKKAEEEAAAEAEAAAAAIAAAQAQEEAAATDTPDAGSSGGSSNGGAPGGVGDIDWSSDKTSFVGEWTGRIDAYLAGSPLAGQGKTFAEAAWNYGVDPRWSPAISNTESSKGLYCFRPHNAWGWGQVSWGSWEEAIDAHVRGLARGYGYTITIEGAQKYCENWEHWYNSTLNQMNMI